MSFPDLADEVIAPEDSLEHRILRRIGTASVIFASSNAPKG